MSLTFGISGVVSVLKRLTRWSFLTVLVLVSANIGIASEFTATTSTNLSTRIDALFAEWDTTNAPGCAVAVVKNGQPVYLRGYGIATKSKRKHVKCS